MRTFIKIIGVIFVIGLIGTMMENEPKPKSNFEQFSTKKNKKQNKKSAYKAELSSSQKELTNKTNENQKGDKKLKSVFDKAKGQIGKVLKKKDKGDCVKFVSLHSAKYLANEFGWSEMRVVREHKVNLWEKTSAQGKGRKIGEMLPGSNARLIDKRGSDYYVQSPLDKSKGWVSDIQVSKVVRLNPKTYKKCK